MEGEAGLDNTGPETGERDAASRDKSGFGDAGRRHRAAPDMPDLGSLAQDWVTLWQSELSAMAADPEIRESWQTMAALWAGTMAAMLRGLPAPHHDGAPGRTWPADAPRTPPATAAPDARDAEVERLARHVAALESRLAELERGGNPPVHPKSRPRRKQRG
jgi:hypothetical protein